MFFCLFLFMIVWPLNIYFPEHITCDHLEPCNLPWHLRFLSLSLALLNQSSFRAFSLASNNCIMQQSHPKNRLHKGLVDSYIVPWEIGGSQNATWKGKNAAVIRKETQTLVTEESHTSRLSASRTFPPFIAFSTRKPFQLGNLNS